MSQVRDIRNEAEAANDVVTRRSSTTLDQHLKRETTLGSRPRPSPGNEETAPHLPVRGGAGSVAVATGPDEAVSAGLVAFDQGGVDRSGEAGIVQLDREILTTLAGGLLPGGPELDRALEDAVVGRLVVSLVGGLDRGLGVDAEGPDRAGEAVARAGEGADLSHPRVS